MSEKLLRNVFVVGTIVFLGVLGAMSLDTLGQVEKGRTPPVTEQVAHGKQVWQDKNCNDCHTILGIGGYFAPELTKVADRRGADWLNLYLKSPQQAAPAATMPNQRLTEAQVQDLTAFFQWVAKIDTNDWPPQPLVAAGAPGAGLSGDLLVQQKGCLGCHALGGQGASGPGPDLSRAGARLSADTIAKLLADPRSVNPGATMPRVPLSDAEREAIARYLAQLK